MKLSTSAKSALEIVREKHLAYMIAKTNIEAELKRELALRLENIRNERDNALRYADQMGVPRTQLGKAIGTTNYKTVQEILGSTALISSGSNASVSSVEKLKIDLISDGICQVYLTDIGDTGFSGTAVVGLDGENELRFIDGDVAVITQIYRNDLLDNVLNVLNPNVAI